MHNNYFFLKHLATELNTKLAGMQLKSCFSQEKDELMVAFGFKQADSYIKATLRPDFSCINLLENYSRARKNTVDLWPELYGGKVVKIQVFENERAFYILLDNGFQLVFKLFGNRPNLLIFYKDTLHYVFNNSLLTDRNSELSDFKRHLKISFQDYSNKNFDLQKTVPTLGKMVIEYLEKQFKNGQELDNWEIVNGFLQSTEKPEFFIGKVGGKPVLSLFEPQDYSEKHDNAISAVNAFYSFYQKEFYFYQEKERLKKVFEKEIIKTKNYISKTSGKLKELQSGLSNEKLGHLLMANLHVDHDASESIVLHDFYNDTTITVKIKKGLSLLKNAELYYRKSKNEKIEFDSLNANLESSKIKLENLIIQLDNLENILEFKSLKGLQKSLNKVSEIEKDENPFRIFKIENWDVWVGKNSKNNDLLTQKYAQKDDYWLHARDTSGSHVVIKNPLKLSVPEHIAEQVASIAAFYSKRNTEGLVPVIFTQKKYVRKTRSLKPGQVIVDKEKVLLVPPHLY
jgi:predicted ribosome quality control (RQC) complex YloA/Tae2 family protein